jgi:hypothetical protein
MMQFTHDHWDGLFWDSEGFKQWRSRPINLLDLDRRDKYVVDGPLLMLEDAQTLVVFFFFAKFR